jgi:16S rRNA processing protein RimM
VLGAHGIAGSVRVKSFTADPAAVAIYGPVSDEAGERTFVLSVAAVRPDSVIVRIEGVADREAATALRGTRLYVARDRLPEPDADEFYHADLLGLAAATPDGEAFGRIVAVHESGAGDTLEIARDGGLPPAMVPFTRAAVPEVDLRAGRVVVVPDSVVAEDQGEEAP